MTLLPCALLTVSTAQTQIFILPHLFVFSIFLGVFICFQVLRFYLFFFPSEKNLLSHKTGINRDKSNVTIAAPASASNAYLTETQAGAESCSEIGCQGEINTQSPSHVLRVVLKL